MSPGALAAPTPPTPQTPPTPYAPFASRWPLEAHLMPHHHAPVHISRDTVWLRLELTSPHRDIDKLKYLAGSEAAMGAWTAEILPEETAERIRDAIAQVVA